MDFFTLEPAVTKGPHGVLLKEEEERRAVQRLAFDRVMTRNPGLLGEQTFFRGQHQLLGIDQLAAQPLAVGLSRIG